MSVVRVGEVEAIDSPSIIFNSQDILKDLVELPLVESCKVLFDKNIMTCSSSANKNDEEAYIQLDFDSLSDENKEIGREIGKYIEHLGIRVIRISFRISSENYIMDVNQRMLNLVSKFKIQKLTWGFHNFDSFKRLNPLSSEEDFRKHKLYDRELNVVWRSEELMNKSKKIIN